MIAFACTLLDFFSSAILKSTNLPKECPSEMKFLQDRFLRPRIAHEENLARIQKFFSKAYQFGKKKFSIFKKSSRKFVRLDERITNLCFFFFPIPGSTKIFRKDGQTDGQTRAFEPLDFFPIFKNRKILKAS